MNTGYQFALRSVDSTLGPDAITPSIYYQIHYYRQSFQIGSSCQINSVDLKCNFTIHNLQSLISESLPLRLRLRIKHSNTYQKLLCLIYIISSNFLYKNHYIVLNFLCSSTYLHEMFIRHNTCHMNSNKQILQKKNYTG